VRTGVPPELAQVVKFKGMGILTEDGEQGRKAGGTPLPEPIPDLRRREVEKANRKNFFQKGVDRWGRDRLQTLLPLRGEGLRHKKYLLTAMA
jgi:hypothetical protein